MFKSISMEDITVKYTVAVINSTIGTSCIENATFHDAFIWNFSIYQKDSDFLFKFL